jgi:glycine/D-amino acid oxidase-like deaminating enzyme
MALGLAAHAGRLGAQLFERTPVLRLRPGRAHIEVVAGTGSIRAAAAVVATGVPQPELRALHRHLKDVGATVTVVPPLSTAVRRAFGASAGLVRDSAEPVHAWRLGRDGSLVAWQGGQPPVPARQRDAAAVQRTGQLMYELSVLYPVLSGLQPTHGWTTSSYRSVDGLVIAGAHRAFPRHLFAVGLGADGLQGAYLAARLNLRHYRGSPAKGDELFGFIR